jgi:hypothetical protein
VHIFAFKNTLLPLKVRFQAQTYVCGLIMDAFRINNLSFGDQIFLITPQFIIIPLLPPAPGPIE